MFLRIIFKLSKVITLTPNTVICFLVVIEISLLYLSSFSLVFLRYGIYAKKNFLPDVNVVYFNFYKYQHLPFIWT